MSKCVLSRVGETVSCVAEMFGIIFIYRYEGIFPNLCAERNEMR